MASSTRNTSKGTNRNRPLTKNQLPRHLVNADSTEAALESGTELQSGYLWLRGTDARINVGDSQTYQSQGIQLEYNSGTPRMYIGDGSNKYLEFDGTDLLLGPDSKFGTALARTITCDEAGGQDFTSLSDAIEEASRFHYSFDNSSTYRCTITVTGNITEQITFNGQDLGWLDIEFDAVDWTTTSGFSSHSFNGGGIFTPLVLGINGARLPNFNGDMSISHNTSSVCVFGLDSHSIGTFNFNGAGGMAWTNTSASANANSVMYTLGGASEAWIQNITGAMSSTTHLAGILDARGGSTVHIDTTNNTVCKGPGIYCQDPGTRVVLDSVNLTTTYSGDTVNVRNGAEFIAYNSVLSNTTSTATLAALEVDDATARLHNTDLEGDNRGIYTLAGGIVYLHDACELNDANLTYAIYGSGGVVHDLGGWNTGSRIDFSKVFNIQNVITDVDNVSVTLLNSWTNFGGAYQGVSVRRHGGMVTLEGLIDGGSSATATMFTLPEGFRPAGRLIFATYSNSGVCRLDVQSDGTVSAVAGGSTTWTSLSGVTFQARN